MDDDAPATPSAAGPRKPSPISRAGMHRARAALLKKATEAAAAIRISRWGSGVWLS